MYENYSLMIVVFCPVVIYLQYIYWTAMDMSTFTSDNLLKQYDKHT